MSFAVDCRYRTQHQLKDYLSFSGHGQAVSVEGHAANHGPSIFVARLDHVIEDATRIKLEVEGSELAALQGANRLIREKRLTVSVSM